MTSAASLPERLPLTKQDVITAALNLIEAGGSQALTMRKLAAELGVAPTAIYWHVGNRDALVEALIARAVEGLDLIAPSGSTPAQRVISIARAIHDQLLAHRHLVALVHEHGMTAKLFVPAQEALARELHAAGLQPSAVACGVQAIEYHVIGCVVLERWIERQPPQQRPGPADVRARFEAAGLPPEVGAALAQPPDHSSIFEFTTRVLVEALLAL